MLQIPTAVIFLGASCYPNFRDLDRGGSFYAAHNSINNYVNEFESIGFSKIIQLNLFDDTRLPSEQLAEVRAFLIEASASGCGNLLFHYVGHGYFRNPDNSFCWSLHSTRKDNIFSTSMHAIDLFSCVKEMVAHFHIYGIIDSCFSGAAAELFLSPDNLSKKIYEEAMRELPHGGTALICSSSRTSLSYVEKDGEQTVFGRALSEIVHGWGEPEKERRILNSLEVVERSRSWIKLNHVDDSKISLPEIHAPQQKNGNLLTVPFFPIIRKNKLQEIIVLPKKEELVMMDKNPFDFVDRGQERKIRDICEAATKAREEMLVFLSRTNILDKTYAVRSRTKTHKRFVEKFLSKCEEKGNYKIEDITDVIGLRFITLYRESILDVVDELCDILEGSHDVRPSPFAPDSLNEFIVYTAAPQTDPSNICNSIRKIFEEKISKKSIFKIKDRQVYSSIHLTCGLVSGGVVVPIEIQIRSVFEDAWGEIDHKLRYGRSRTSFELESAKPVPGTSELHLRHLKKLLDLAADYADTIRRDVNAAFDRGRRSHAPDRRINENLDSLDYIESVFQKFGIPEDVRNGILSILRKKDVLDKKRRERHSASFSEKYDRLAEDLNDLYLSEMKPGGYLSQTGEGPRCAIYYLRMEEALCRLLTSDDAAAEVAREIYGDLLIEYPDFIAIHFRLAQTHAKLGNAEYSIKHFELAEKLLEEHKKYGKEVDIYSLPEHQIGYISKNLPRLLGFQYWVRAHDYMDRNEFGRAYEDVVKARRTTQESLSLENDETSIREYFLSLNNCMYYSLYLKAMIDEGKVEKNGENDILNFLNDDCVRLEEMLNTHRDALSSRNKKAGWHTLIEGYAALNKYNEKYRAVNRYIEVKDEGGDLEQMGRIEAKYRIKADQLVIKLLREK